MSQSAMCAGSVAKKDGNLNIRLDPETRVALERLAQADERSLAAQIRHMVRTEALRRGMWHPGTLTPVQQRGRV